MSSTSFSREWGEHTRAGDLTRSIDPNSVNGTYSCGTVPDFHRLRRFPVIIWLYMDCMPRTLKRQCRSGRGETPLTSIGNPETMK